MSEKVRNLLLVVVFLFVSAIVASCSPEDVEEWYGNDSSAESTSPVAKPDKPKPVSIPKIHCSGGYCTIVWD